MKTVPSTMSGKTVIAFLRHSNVEELNWLIDLPFTDQDQVQLT
jgi:beta-lactamase superfamily II metal-dependent hydrolase